MKKKFNLNEYLRHLQESYTDPVGDEIYLDCENWYDKESDREEEICSRIEDKQQKTKCRAIAAVRYLQGMINCYKKNIHKCNEIPEYSEECKKRIEGHIVTHIRYLENAKKRLQIILSKE